MVKEPHFTPKKMLSMLGLQSDSLGPYALIPGPKERSQMLLGMLKDAAKNFSFLDYEMHTGTIDGKRVTVGNGGRFAPDTAMTTEILCAAGAESLIRIGSCGALSADIKVGDLIVATGCVRGDGVTPYYVDQKFETKPDAALTQTITKVAEGVMAPMGVSLHRSTSLRRLSFTKLTRRFHFSYVRSGRRFWSGLRV